MLPSVGDKNRQILLSQGVVLSQSTFHLVMTVFSIVVVIVIDAAVSIIICSYLQPCTMMQVYDESLACV